MKYVVSEEPPRLFSESASALSSGQAVYLLSARLLREVAFMRWLGIKSARPPALDAAALSSGAG
jgi:hypothetical protein